MLQITIPAREYFDENTQEFRMHGRQTLNLEHSLLSIKKWESKWKKPFLAREPKSFEESIDYVRCMTLNQNVDPEVYYGLTRQLFEKINNYIEDPMTATWFNDQQKKKTGGPVITAELIYYWMVAFQIPFECQKWHLNSLLTLIHICEIKNAPSKKMKKKDIYARNAALNASRKKNLGTRG